MPIIITGIIIVFLAFAVIVKLQHSSELKGLPNYTQIKGDFTKLDIDYDKQPHKGDAAAKVKVVEFADFKCPMCKKWEEQFMDKFQKDFIDTGKVQLYFMNYAFIDRDSILAASAGEAIAKQNNDKFWEYYTKLFANQGDEKEIWATQKFILNFVKKNISGIDYNQFEKDLKNNTYGYDVKLDYKIAGHLGVNGTPQLMVNGKLLPNAFDYNAIKAAIEQELAK